ncbi:MAG: hypothetical protein ABIR60_11990 [Allosphingosinicella sp.]
MDDLRRLELTPEQLRALPLGLRTIYYKDLPKRAEGNAHHRIEPYGGLVTPNNAFRKAVSRLHDA